ncbi:MAG: metal-dependent hydrolase [Candidatus Solibacter usitatus]|nr:metal-dependent hydrolase [Candidatus Solibacter usitatus]
MDNLTHTLTGLMLARTGLNRWCPGGTAILLLSANAPDIDVVAGWKDSLTYLDHHRGYTHALIAAPLMAALVVLVVRLAGRKPVPWIKGIAAGCIGVLSHLLLDWTNTYGIRLLLPFSDRWLRLDITNVVDIWIWAILAMAVAGPMLSKLVSSEMGAKSGTGRGAAITALVLLFVYEAGRFTLHARAVASIDAHLYQGHAPRKVEAYPHFANPLTWTAMVDTGEAVILQRTSLLNAYDPTGGKTWYQPEPHPAIEKARATATFRRYLNFAQTVYWRSTPVDKPEGGVRVEACDLRFGDPDAPRFIASAVLDRALKVAGEKYSFGPLRPR